MRGFRATAMALLGLLSAADAAASSDRVVAVLYFDNNTGNAELDVLKKGFADMMVTDLAAVSSLQVVERDRLEALLDELKLQRTRYFDSKTAAKIGRGLGAQYAVTGAFAALDPQMRIDVRMIEIATGKVVVADKVVGDKTKLFDLQSRLVAKFVGALDARAPPKRAIGAVQDVESLLEYSKSVDLADAGKLADASAAMKALVKKHPTMILARAKHQQILRRLEDAKTRREAVIEASGLSLERRAATYLAKHEIGADQDAVKTHLAYRAVLDVFFLRALEPHLVTEPVHYVRPDHEDAAYRILRAAYANLSKRVAEADAYAAAFAKTLPNGAPYLDTRAELPKDVIEEAKRFDIARTYDASSVGARADLARFVLLGELFDGKRHATVAPVLATIDPKLEAVGFSALDEAYSICRENGSPEFVCTSLMVTKGEAYLLRDRTEEAIAAYQRVLDDYPASSQYARVEKRIQVELGMKRDHARTTYAGVLRAFETCEDMEFRKGLPTYLRQRVTLFGRPAIFDMVERIEKACLSNDRLRKHFWSYLYMKAALYGGTRDDCALFETMVKKYLAADGSRGDLRGYRKNYAKTCKQ